MEPATLQMIMLAGKATKDSAINSQPRFILAVFLWKPNDTDIYKKKFVDKRTYIRIK
jgi:hypothetical protein